MKSVVRATDIDVLPPDHEVSRRDEYWVVRCPSNPGFYWGNLLIFDRPPARGDRDRWLAHFVREFPGLGHRTFAWDVTDGSVGEAASEFADFEVDREVGLLATRARCRRRPGWTGS